jgi:hypothetical protein
MEHAYFYVNSIITIISLIIILVILHFLLYPVLKRSRQFKLDEKEFKLALQNELKKGF